MNAILYQKQLLTHRGRDKMAAISQTTYSIAFLMKMYQVRLRFHWSLFIRIQLRIFQLWFRYSFGTEQATNHYLNQSWHSLLTHIFVTRPQWFNQWRNVSFVWGRLKDIVSCIVFNLKNGCVEISRVNRKQQTTLWCIKCRLSKTYCLHNDFSNSASVGITRWEECSCVFIIILCLIG